MCILVCLYTLAYFLPACIRLVQTGGRLEPTTPDAVQPRRTASGHAGHRPTSPAGGRPRPARPTTGRPPARQSDQRPAWPTYEIQNVKTPEFKLAALSGRFWDTSFFGPMVNQRPATSQPGTHHSGHGRPGRPASGQAGRRPARPDGVRTGRPTTGSVRPGRPETRTSLQWARQARDRCTRGVLVHVSPEPTSPISTEA